MACPQGGGYVPGPECGGPIHVIVDPTPLVPDNHGGIAQPGSYGPSTSTTDPNAGIMIVLILILIVLIIGVSAFIATRVRS